MYAKKVLLIDDEELILLTTRLLLHKHNIETVCTSNAQKGLDIASQEKIDLILLDLNMPEIDGWEVLRLLKENSTTKTIPVILFTAGDYNATNNDLKKWDVIAFLNKPFNLKELLSIINTI